MSAPTCAYASDALTGEAADVVVIGGGAADMGRRFASGPAGTTDVSGV